MTANKHWEEQVLRLLASEYTFRPRGLETLEFTASQQQFDMRWPVVTNKPRCLNYRFMAAEALWILSGMQHTSWIAQYCKNIAQFSDTGLIQQGAYGPRFVEQLPYVGETLRDDPHSRQAVIDIWRPMPRPGKDIPCTLSLQFLIRGMHMKRLDTVVTMRSSDVWLGLPYDMFCFTMMSMYLALFMRDRQWCSPDIELGTMTINMGSSHLYMNNVVAARIAVEHATLLDGKIDESVYPDGPVLSPAQFAGTEALMSWLTSRTDSVNQAPLYHH